MHWFRRHDRGRPPHPDVLTPAEWRVLEHVRQGVPNAEIAVRLGISVNTVRVHVSNMLAKLELPDRQALAAWEGEPAEASRRRPERVPFALPFAELGSAIRVGAASGVAVLGAAVVWAAIGVASDGGATNGAVDPPMPEPTPAAEATPVSLVDGLPEGTVGPLLLYMHREMNLRLATAHGPRWRWSSTTPGRVGTSPRSRSGRSSGTRPPP